MSIKFRPLGRKNPQDRTLPEKYYASVVADGSVDFETLAESISQQCTVTEADCIAVLTVLERTVVSELKQGRIVRMGKIGNFQIGISSDGEDTLAEVTANSITKTRVLFRPGKKMRELLSNLSFRKAG